MKFAEIPVLVRDENYVPDQLDIEGDKLLIKALNGLIKTNRNKKLEKKLNRLKDSLVLLRLKLDRMLEKEEALEKEIYLVECEITGTIPDKYIVLSDDSDEEDE